ncbi:hypothetical protein JOD45_002722 [Scopulibacillus daqui]|uniref:DUF6884 domain-containing protein n=1 Tax=Scopulibacillus daqui TaxID=1469162 RepID=A0ABS2Q4S2_9BACL|nr:DUF6884 domain-containing protein [Scopulibacillus daqui]MBM7646492.1 hypothetical protein [Scopulibacillus daqui]
MAEKIGLLATARKKSNSPEKVIDFYKSPLFIKSVQYAKTHYKRFYFYNAKDGLLLPDQIMSPYDVSIKRFTIHEKRIWGKKVIQDFLSYETPEDKIIYLHGGQVYRKFLEPELKQQGFIYEIPLKGLGIGEQLKWYEHHIDS